MSQAGDALARGIADVLDQALRERTRRRRRRTSATADVKQIDAAIANLRAIDERIAEIRQRVWSPDARPGTRRRRRGRLMGILDRIAGTLDELTGDTDAAAASEVMRAHALADAGDIGRRRGGAAGGAGAVPALRAGASPRAGELDARRGRLEDAVTRARARGRSRTAGGPSRGTRWATRWRALGRTEPARDALRRALTLGLEPSFNARVYAALGRVHAARGRVDRGARGRCARRWSCTGPGEDDRGVALDYGRALAEARRSRGDRVADARGARRRRARAGDRRGGGGHRRSRAGGGAAARGAGALPGRSGAARGAGAAARAASGAPTRRSRSPRRASPRRPTTPTALGALRDSYAAAGALERRPARRRRRRRASARPPPLAVRVTLALGAEDRAALGRAGDADARPIPARPSDPLSPLGERVRVRGSDDEDAPLRAALAAFAAGHASEADLLRLGRLAPSRRRARLPRARPDAATARGPARRACSPGRTTCSRAAPPLVGLAAAAGHAAEALDRPLLVAVMGEFNAGKSSFVNALAGADVAPTGVTPTTATVNVLRYGAEPAARVVAHDGGTRPLAAADVARFLTGLRADEARAIRMVEIFLPVETLRRVEIVDTPGLELDPRPSTSA